MDIAWEELKQLVDGWHSAASEIEGYEDTTDTGDGVRLMLFMNRTKEGDLRLSVLSVKDFLSTVSPAHLLQAKDVEKADQPIIPFAGITIPG